MEEKTMRRNCRYSRLCKSTRRGTWIDCSLGKGLICMPNSKFCKYEPYKIKDIKEVIICECQSLKSDKDCDSSLEQQLQLKDNEIIRLQTLLDDYRTLGETNIKELKEELQLKDKMIELMLNEWCEFSYNFTERAAETREKFKQQAQQTEWEY